MDQQLSVGRRAAPALVDHYAIPSLRVSLAITYIWFGALKIVGRSPVSDLIAKTAYFLPKRAILPLLGVWEVAIGIGLLFRLALNLTLPLFFFQIASTFAVFVIRPEEAFQKGNPLLLTKDGEFILKNLVLAAAGVAVGSRIGHKSEEID